MFLEGYSYTSRQEMETERKKQKVEGRVTACQLTCLLCSRYILYETNKHMHMKCEGEMTGKTCCFILAT